MRNALTPHSGDLYDLYLGACLDGSAEDPGTFLARHPEADAEACDLIRALHAEYLVPPAHDPAELPFERLGGYRLVRPLGVGGMGSVYLAEQEALGRTIALKVVRPELGASAVTLRRFRREARAIARLRHPGIVSVYELSEDRGVHYIAMEFVPGRPLDELLRAPETIPVHRLLQWMAQIGRALAYAHERGVVHRDVKPSNILITPDDRAVLLDFGIAFLTGQEATRLTQSFAGSPLYAAPEQVSGAPVDARTDVYLLGVTTYEAITGALPFHGGSLENVFRRILLEDARPPSRLGAAVPADADVVILKAMEKKPEARYADMSAFAADLEALSRSRPVQARPPGAMPRLRKWTRRRPVAATVLAGVTLAAVVVGTLLIHSAATRSAQRREDAAAYVGRARAVLRAYRTARLESKEFEEDFRDATQKVENAYTTEAEDQHLEELVDEAARAGFERDLMFGQVLELVQQARTLHAEVQGVDEVTAQLWLERLEEARARGNPEAVQRFRTEILKHDPDGRHTGSFLKAGTLSVNTEPPGFEVYVFRHEVQRDVLAGGERRLVPVPMGRGATTPVPPGTWTLRVVRGAGNIRPGDQILEVFGHPIDGTYLAASAHGQVQRGDRLVAIDGRRVRLMIDATPPRGAGPHRYVFERAGQEFDLQWDEPPVTLLSAAAMAERGGVPARVYQHGVVRSVTLPEGLGVRTTAVPLFVSPACLLGETPTKSVPWEPGRYLLLLRREGYEDELVQRRVPGGQHLSLSLYPNPIGTSPPGFVFVSYGYFDEPSFWIQEHEVTSAEYLEYLNDPEVLARVDAALKEGRYIRYPRDDQTNTATGGHWIRSREGHFELPPGWLESHPVRGLSLEDAKAYARWRGRREGRRYALPTRKEWRNACQGDSDFKYPFGDVFRPKWVSALHVRPTFRGYDPVMSFPVDESATGAYDLSGSVTEWLDWDGGRGFRGMAAGGSALRGQAWEFATHSMHMRETEYAGGDVGFRLVLRRPNHVHSGPK